MSYLILSITIFFSRDLVLDLVHGDGGNSSGRGSIRHDRHLPLPDEQHRRKPAAPRRPSQPGYRTQVPEAIYFLNQG